MDNDRTTRDDDLAGTPEVAILKAMGAYDNFGRHTVMAQRAKLTKTQMDVVIGLDLFGTMSMTQMSEHLAASKEQASRSVAPLVEAGLVKRERSPREHRVVEMGPERPESQVEISLTERGKEFGRAHKQEAAESVRARLALLPKEERDQLVEASRTAERLLCKLREIELGRKGARSCAPAGGDARGEGSGRKSRTDATQEQQA